NTSNRRSRGDSSAMSLKSSASTARSVALRWAASIASVEANSPRNWVSDTPARPAISAKPISSKGFSARSARKAATILSRSLTGAAGPAGLRLEDDRADLAADLRAGLRAMTELLDGDLNAGLINQCRRPRPRFQGGMPSVGQLPRTLRRGRDRPIHQQRQAVLAHQHVQRRDGGAARRGDILAQRAGVERGAVEQFARAGDGFAGELCRQRLRQAGCG